MDVEHLWPAIRENARDTETARWAFYAHMVADPAWRDLSDEELILFVHNL